MSIDHLSEKDCSYLEDAMQKHCIFIEQKIIDLLTSQQASTLTEAAIYSCKGGKKLRSFLVVECAKLYGCNQDLALTVSATLEMIHTYSLIHDDLPALDNDD